jgi:hypothetical protein
VLSWCDAADMLPSAVAPHSVAGELRALALVAARIAMRAIARGEAMGLRTARSDHGVKLPRYGDEGSHAQHHEDQCQPVRNHDLAQGAPRVSARMMMMTSSSVSPPLG